MLWTSSLFKTDSSGCRGQVGPTTIPPPPTPLSFLCFSIHFFFILTLYPHRYFFICLFRNVQLATYTPSARRSPAVPPIANTIRRQTRRNKQEDFSRKLCCKENHRNSSTNQVVFLLSFATLSLNFAKLYTFPSWSILAYNRLDAKRKSQRDHRLTHVQQIKVTILVRFQGKRKTQYIYIFHILQGNRVTWHKTATRPTVSTSSSIHPYVSRTNVLTELPNILVIDVNTKNLLGRFCCDRNKLPRIIFHTNFDFPKTNFYV